MQAIDGILSIYVTGEYTKMHLDDLNTKITDCRVYKFNRKLTNSIAVFDYFTNCIINADFVIVICPDINPMEEYYGDQYTQLGVEIGYAKALNRRILIVGDGLWDASEIAVAAADFSAKTWEDALSVLTSFTQIDSVQGELI